MIIMKISDAMAVLEQQELLRVVAALDDCPTNSQSEQGVGLVALQQNLLA
jgi:hypothetical protein